MAWNGSGTYVLNPTYSPEVNGTTIDAVRYNGLLNDVATGISQAINKNGENSPTTNINWGGFKITNVAAPTALGDVLSFGRAITVTTILSSAGIELPATTALGLAGTTGSLLLGYLTGAITSITDAYIAWAGAGAPLNTLTTNGTLVYAARNTAGAGHQWATANAVRMTLDYSGQLGIGCIPFANAPFQVKVGVDQILGVITQGSKVTVGGFTNAGAAAPIRIAGSGVTISGDGTNTHFDMTTGGVITALGVAIAKVKTAATSRNSTTTLADDAHLVCALSAGTWAVRLWLPTTIAVSGGGNGWKVALGGSATISSSLLTVASNDTSYALANQITVAGTFLATASSGAGIMVIEGSVVVSVAGNLSFQWAQNSSGAQNLTFMQGATMICTKVG